MQTEAAGAPATTPATTTTTTTSSGTALGGTATPTPAAPAAGVTAADKVAAVTTTTEEPKPTTQEGEPSKDAKAAPVEVEVKLPDGVAPDAVLMDEFKPLAKELGLKSDQAQKLVDLALKMQSRGVEQMQAAWSKQNETWVNQIKADKELGGADQDVQAKAAIARKALQRFGGPELAKEIDAHGLGNHPGLLRAFYRAGLAIKEDSVQGRLGSGGAPMSDEDRMKQRYPNTPQFHG